MQLLKLFLKNNGWCCRFTEFSVKWQLQFRKKTVIFINVEEFKKSQFDSNLSNLLLVSKNLCWYCFMSCVGFSYRTNVRHSFIFLYNRFISTKKSVQHFFWCSRWFWQSCFNKAYHMNFYTLLMSRCSDPLFSSSYHAQWHLDTFTFAMPL